MKKSNSQVSRGNRPRNQNGRVRRLAQPPQIPTNVQIVHTYRFTSTAGTATNIGETMLRGIAGAMCDVANGELRILANSVKVHRVSIWTPPASQGAAATCSLTWSTTGTYAPMVEESDTTLSTAVPAHISTKPPPGSAASFWLGSGTNTIMTVVAPTGSVIDVHCTHVLQDTGTAGTAYTVAAGTLGALYYCPLDGTGDVYLPAALTTTT